MTVHWLHCSHCYLFYHFWDVLQLALFVFTGFKESSFLYAISSASLVHTFARACSRGAIDRCTCDESKNHRRNRLAWQWGGCGDNIRFGVKFSRRFLRAGKRRGKDVRAKVEQHNIRLGRKVSTCTCFLFTLSPY